LVVPLAVANHCVVGYNGTSFKEGLIMFGLFALAILAIVVAVAIVILLNQKTLGVVAGALVMVVGVLAQSFTVISAGHTGVQVTLGEVNHQPLTEGVHFVNPISQIKDVDVRLQKDQLAGASASTKDLQQVHTDIVVQYRLNAAKVPQIYKEFGLNVDEKVLGPAINEAFKTVTAHYTSEQLITMRQVVSDEIQQILKAKVAPFDIDVSGISLVNFGFSADYQKAIEQKVISVQQTAKAEQDLKRIEVEARSRIAQADGEAKAIAIQAAAIQSNGGQNYVQLEWIKRWNGKLPETVVNGSTGMMLNMGK
jgi:regulator of protease activity HflC (stomatin/prohibitin superfamily)